MARFPRRRRQSPAPLRSGHEGRCHERHRVPEPRAQARQQYRFASIGRTSAGAIAAALSAAAEYGRQRDEGGGPTSSWPRSITGEPGAIVGLFQPTPATKPLFEVITKALLAKRSRWRRIAFVAGVAAKRRARAVVVGLLLLIALLLSIAGVFWKF